MNKANDIESLRNSPLNQQSVEDLRKIRQILVEQQLGVGDMQFLVAQDGRVVISDPQRPYKLIPGDTQYYEAIERIDAFIEAAETAIQSRN